MRNSSPIKELQRKQNIKIELQLNINSRPEEKKFVASNKPTELMDPELVDQELREENINEPIDQEQFF